MAAAAESVLVAQDSLLVARQPIADTAEVDHLPSGEPLARTPTGRASSPSSSCGGRLSGPGLDPTTADDGYRVVVGPYPTREAAEEAGRKLGRPYFVLTNPPVKQC